MVSVRAKTGALVVLTSMAMAACTTGGNETESPTEAKVSIAMVGDPSTLDPHKSTPAHELMMARMMFDTLVRRDDGGKMIAGLAKSWTVTPTSGEFVLRDDVTCADGTKLTATTVAKSMTRFADPKTGATAAGQVFGTANLGKATFTGDDAASKLTVKLDQPWADLIFGLSLPQAGVICDKGLTDEAALKAGTKGVGTGPYFLAGDSAVQKGVSYTLTGRPEYKWAPVYARMPSGKVPTTVVMKVILKEDVMANELLANNLDYGGITGPDIARLPAKDFNIKPAPLIRAFVVFNQRPGRPGADPAFRKAFAQAIDRTAFNQAVTRGTGTLMAGITDPAVPCANKDESLLVKPDAAAAKAGLTGKKVKIVGHTAVAAGAPAEYALTALKAAGADAELRNVDLATWTNDVFSNKGDWDVTVLTNLNLTNMLTPPAALLIGSAPEGTPPGRNFGAIQNPAFARAFGMAMAAPDPTAQCAAWGEAQKALLEQVNVIPLAAINVNYVTTKRATGSDPDGIFDPTTMRVVG
ncbi:ABC transporter substrate-binding protein [Catelliglobosispora koreensis]|uniref:ABC transporter substrate-binding protein n=1 Tax=Catelliglobosispora koreensis TaxID=129052 RepID=UPI0003678681|nr:ABC transporter substrate-binding protein [Catelliglobosispora koreensis]